MRKLTLILLTLHAININSQAADRRDFTGNYKLEKTVNGLCPQDMIVKTESFTNETSTPSLSFYCSGDENTGCVRVIYQLPDINSGYIRKLNQNPMTGFYDTVVFSNQILVNNTLTAENKTTNLLGKIIWKTNFKAVLEGNKLSYEFAEINNIVNENTQSSCVYTRI